MDEKNHFIILDGAMGTMLQKAGLKLGERPEIFGMEHPEILKKIQRAYIDAGSNIIYANTFGANAHKLRGTGHSVEELVRTNVAAARRAASAVSAEQTGERNRQVRVALDVGPIGELMEPLGTLAFADAYEIYREMVVAGEAAGADLVVFETMTDLYEVKAAVLAAKENTSLPIWVTMSFEKNGRTFTGTTVASMASVLDGLGVDAMGINCSLGPEEIFPLIAEMRQWTDRSLIVKPNAGLPDPATGEYDMDAQTFARQMLRYREVGVYIMGGCCGTTPEFIRELRTALEDQGETNSVFLLQEDGKAFVPIDGRGAESQAVIKGLGKEQSVTKSGIEDVFLQEEKQEEDQPAESEFSKESFLPTENQISIKKRRGVCSASQMVEFGGVRVIGERINPTGKKRFGQALREHDMNYIMERAIAQADAGADILDINVGLPGIDEPSMMTDVVQAVQSVVSLPLQIDSSNPAAIEAGLRICNGRAIVNSVNAEDEVLAKVLPIVKKYGAAVVGLTMDKSGIPDTAEKRFALAEKIMHAAEAIGIPREDVLIDCLTLTISAQQEQAMETLKAVRMVHERLGLHCVLGVSNISFGLPKRLHITTSFLTQAMYCGLDFPIVNPNQQEVMDAVVSFRALSGEDHQCGAYIEWFANREEAVLSAGNGYGASGGMASGAGQIGVGQGGMASGTGQGGVRQGGPASGVGQSREVARVGYHGSAGGSGGDVSGSGQMTVEAAVLKGLKEETRKLTAQLLAEMSELDVINEKLIPALDVVGERYEQQKIFLPQLINSANAACAGFELIKERIAKRGGESVSKGKIILATVEGDIHDIGKNIVRVVLENYGYQVIDLGRDVPVQKVVDVAIAKDVRLIGLSALMTTTVVSMKKTIEAIRASGHDCKIFVGGAVLTPEYADEIGADYYTRDAKASVDVAREVLG